MTYFIFIITVIEIESKKCNFIVSYIYETVLYQTDISPFDLEVWHLFIRFGGLSCRKPLKFFGACFFINKSGDTLWWTPTLSVQIIKALTNPISFCLEFQCVQPMQTIKRFKIVVRKQKNYLHTQTDRQKDCKCSLWPKLFTFNISY